MLRYCFIVVNIIVCISKTLNSSNYSDIIGAFCLTVFDCRHQDSPTASKSDPAKVNPIIPRHTDTAIAIKTQHLGQGSFGSLKR